MFKYIPLLYTAVVQLKNVAEYTTSSKRLRKMVSFGYADKLQHGLKLSAFSKRVLSRALSMSMDAPMTRYSMPRESL